jgi:shikimate dehydrogenase
MLRVVVAAPPLVGAPEDLTALPACADLVELRLDLLRLEGEAELRAWVEASPRPVLATVRSTAEGGGFSGGGDAAAALLQAAARAGAAWIDVEPRVAGHLQALPAGVRIVVSHHGEADVDVPLEIAGRPVTAGKVARPVNDVASLERALSEARSAAGRRPPRSIVPTGALAALRGAFHHPSYLLYGNAGAAVVPGQPDLRALLDELRAGEVGVDAERFGLLGRPPAWSPSPALHNAVFRAQARPAIYMPLPGLGLPAALALPFAGYSVTTPWKTAALAAATSADDTARAVGAANTLTRSPSGGWHAANTDVTAVEAATPRARRGEEAFVYGAGGYARAAAFALMRRGYAVRLGSRDESRGRVLASAVGASWSGTRYERRSADRVFVNATPLGADGSTPHVFAEAAFDGLVVLDAPYRAGGREAGLAAAVRATADRVVGGGQLLLLQAAGQAAAFGGSGAYRDILRFALTPPPCLVLLGLRGAGKTTVGKHVARSLGRPFLDLDDEVERISGRTAGAWIREDGEAAFRRVEATALERVGGRRGVVVAAGGGVVERPGNRAFLSRHAFPVWLDLSPALAARRVRTDEGDRPRLAGAADPEAEARTLFAARAPHWRSLARHVVDATPVAEEVAEAVRGHWMDAGVQSARKSRRA